MLDLHNPGNVTRSRENVTQVAQGQWIDFCDCTGRNHDAIIDLFAHAPQVHFNELIEAFFEFAVGLNDPHGLVEQSQIIRDTDNSGAGARSKAISWLAWVPDTNGDVFVAIKLNYDRLQGNNNTQIQGSPIQHEGRIVRASCLHEIGHVFFHWDSLLTRGLGNVPWASAGAEEEAWCFSYTLLSMAAEQIARRFVESAAEADHVWEYMRDRKF